MSTTPIDTQTASMDFFVQGLTQSYILILLSEVGDKTFFLITILSGKLNKLMLFFFASLAMNMMNALSVGIGSIFPIFLPQIVISIIVIVLFLGFGLKMLYGVVFYKEKDNTEEQEIQENIDKIESAKQMKEPLLQSQVEEES